MNCPRCNTPGYHYELHGFFQCPKTDCGHSWSDGSREAYEAATGEIAPTPGQIAYTQSRIRERSIYAGHMGDAAAGMKIMLPDPAFKAEVDAWHDMGAELMTRISVEPPHEAGEGPEGVAAGRRPSLSAVP